MFYLNLNIRKENENKWKRYSNLFGFQVSKRRDDVPPEKIVYMSVDKRIILFSIKYRSWECVTTNKM